MQVAVVGAGLSGLTIAQELSAFCNVTLFDKSRGVGGRMATRRKEPYYFDHGAQYFTVRTRRFKTIVDQMLKTNTIKPWNAKFCEINNKIATPYRQWSNQYPHYVGTPGMNSVCKVLAQGKELHLKTQVIKIERSSKWSLYTQCGQCFAGYDWLVLAMPPVQILDLISADISFFKTIQKREMLPCYSLMLGFEKPIALNFDAALVKNSIISWVSVNSSKPGRHEPTTLIVNSTNAWAHKNIDRDKQVVIEALDKELQWLLNLNINRAEHIDLQRWRYANIGRNEGDTLFIDPENRIGACGDWAIQGRVEGAFTSGCQLADSIITQCKER